MFRAVADRKADLAVRERSVAEQFRQEPGKTLADTDAALREITADLRDTVDADLSNIGRLRTRYEDQCTTIVTGGGARIEYWSAELDD